MRSLVLLLLLVSTGFLSALSTGCANSPNSEEYYRRASSRSLPPSPLRRRATVAASLP